MPEKIPANEITFREMSEEQAVKTFEDDGYFEYQKRAMRFNHIPLDSPWVVSTARMFVAFYENKPVGVIGFANYKNVLLGAGVHVRKEYRMRGLTSVLIDKLLSEKGSKTLFINFGNKIASSAYRKKGFVDMDKNKLPIEAREAVEGIPTIVDQVQKYMVSSSPRWMEVLKWN